MKTSAIHQRVADFLKDYPPFSYLPPEALDRLAGSGRVLFREKDDMIFEEGRARDRYVYVIQQGGVRLSVSRAGVETLTDLRGPGELVGVGGAAGATAYQRSAHAVEDSILYALDAAEFHKECEAYPRASRFVSVLLNLGPVEPEAGVEGRSVNWFGGAEAPLDWEGGRAMTCAPNLSVREAACRMREVEDGAMVVVNTDGHPIGICTNYDLRCRVATGEISVDAPVSDLMRSPVFTTSPEVSVGGTLLEMMRRGARHLCITEDGTPNTRVLETLSESALMLFYGNNPLLVLRAIGSAEDIDMLAKLRDRADTLLRRGLQTFGDVDWYCEIVAEIDRALIRRAAWLIRRKHGGDYASRASILLLGTAGRREKLARTEVGLAIVVPDPVEVEEAREFLAEMNAALVHCGYARRTQRRDADAESWCHDIEEWSRRIREWVAFDNVLKLHAHLALFDFDPLSPGCPLDEKLRRVFAEALGASPQFISQLAKDAVSHMPPLTFFEGRAVDEDGKPIGVLDINDRAFWAVSDVARLLALESQETRALSTLARLNLARPRFPAAQGVFDDASRAVRIILFLRARNSFLHGGEGNVFSPGALSLTDQALLKFTFRAISALLDFVAKQHDLK
jgi:CBS domain-containing protein